MARPAAMNLNRAVGVTSDRQTAAPGLAVQAPLNVSVGPNNLQALADILGTGANIATSRAAKESEQRVKEETEIINARAEANFWQSEIDEEQMRTSRTYRRRVDVLTGARKAAELALDQSAALEQFSKDNPLADEGEARQFLKDWQARALVDDEGNEIPELANERAAAIITSSLNEAAFKAIESYRGPAQARLKEKGGRETAALFIANGKQRATTIGDMEALRTQLRGFEYTEDEANRIISQSVLALARDTKNPDVIDLVPDVWADGSIGPAADPELLSTLATQGEIIGNLAEAERKEQQYDARFQWNVKADEQIRQGIPLTEEQLEMGRGLGYSAEVLASMQGQARNNAERILAQQQAQLEKDQEDEREYAEVLANPFSFEKGKAEGIFGAQFDRAAASGNTEAANLVIKQAIEVGMLPRTVRNSLNRVPPTLKGYQQWHQQMKAIDQMDDQVFASLGDDARLSYAAFEGLMRLGRFSPEQAFQRMQQRDTERSNRFVRSKVGAEAIDSIADGAGSLAEGKVEFYLKGFAALADISDQQAVDFAEAAFNKDYLVVDGLLYRRSSVPNEETLDWMRVNFARVRTEAGVFTDPDDVIVSEIEGSGMMLFRDARDPTKQLSVSVAELTKERKRQAYNYDAPDRAAAAGLNPWRPIQGETAKAQFKRIRREVDAYERRGINFRSLGEKGWIRFVRDAPERPNKPQNRRGN